MQKKFFIRNINLYIYQPYIRLFVIIFIAAFFAKGSVIFSGNAIDDYTISFGISSDNLTIYFSQGRYISAVVVWGLDAFGVNVNDVCFSLGIVTLFLQTAFIVSILRFVGMEGSPAAGLVGAIMIAHPYLTEIYTFRMALPFYGVGLFFSIIVLEMMTRDPATWTTRAIALLGTLAMLFTYQVFINYFAVAIIFAFIFGKLLHQKNDKLMAYNVYRDRAITLSIISTLSVIVFVACTRITKALNLTQGTSRGNFMTFEQIPERIEQILSGLLKIYWSAEPVFPGWLKTLVALMLLTSVIITFSSFFSENVGKEKIGTVFCLIIAFLLLGPISLGVIVPFDGWWPVPRVIAHVTMIVGLMFLVADSCIQHSGKYFIKSTIFLFRILILVGFVLISNQILADQQKINQWDKMQANRIVSRLEMHPEFGDVKFVHINGGSWGYPVRLRTVQGDMNISAFFPVYSKVPLLSDVSGYALERAIGVKEITGKTYCDTALPWPHAESITVKNDLAIICLKN